jgi:hypothetical protein
MKRLVYAPKISAYIKADSGVYDISDYIVDFTIERKINQVSSAELTIRNPNKKWTNHSYKDSITGEQKIGPIFHPMDPITIFLTRLQNRPVQVFTGYCDQTPYLQLFPGPVPIKASCTLKKLQYTFFDAGLPFMREFLEQNGWFPDEAGSIVKPEAEEQNNRKAVATETNEGVRFGDSGIGELLYKVLNEIGGWPEDTIYIEEMPPSVINLISNLFELFKKEDEQASKELVALLHKIVGTSASGSGGGEVGSAGGAGPASSTPVTAVEVGRAMLSAGFKADTTILAKGMTTVEHESGFGTTPGWDEEHDEGVLGYWQIQQSSHPEFSNACKMNLLCSTKAAFKISEGGKNWEPWAASDFGTSEVPASAWEPYVSKARKAIELGPFVEPTSVPGGKFIP